MSKQSNLDNDQELVSACIDNDPAAQKVLFERYAGKLLAICARYCPNIEDAKDALHEGYIKVFKQIDRFKGTSKLETWMTRIMINTAIDHFKKSIKYRPLDEDEYYQKETIDHADFINFEEDDTIEINRLHEVINGLPDGYRVVFNLYAIEGFTHKEIAEQLDISEGTSKSQLARARKLLQKTLKEKLNIG
jgi:RNA polymerase sigma-70 factor (ECF subfamily)